MIRMIARDNSYLHKEIKDLVIADAVLIIAFSLTMLGGIFGFSGGTLTLNAFLLIIPIVAVAVTLSFVLHELMHKFVAEHYGAIAGFRTSYNGLAITLVTGLFGFLVGIPGATMIYAHNFTKKENGIVSLAGPLTNFAVFGAFLIASYMIPSASAGSYISEAISLTLFISILLAFFNMLPIYPLDGSKVLAWNKPVYIGTMALIFVLMVWKTPLSIFTIIFMMVIALLFSMFYRHVL